MSADGSSFSNIIQLMSNEIEVSDSEIRFLKEFDKLFNAGSIDSALKDMVELDKSIQLSNYLTDSEKKNLRELNAVLYHGFNFQSQNAFERTEWFGCLGGIAVVIGGAASGNPLAIIGGGMMINGFC